MGIVFSAVCLLRHAQGLLLQCPSAEPPVPSLPNDVVIDILSRIPAKSLLRFRCVSKEWCALISDTIVAMYKSRAEPLLVVGSSHDRSLRLIDMDGNVVKVIRNIGSAWKLICTSRDDLVCVIGRSCDVKVVDLHSGKVRQTCRKSGLLGFGRAIPSAGVYKLVYINPSKCEILTVGEDGAGWRPMPLPPTTNISYTSNPVVVNGVLHIMLESQLDGDISVLCFNLAREEWKNGIKGPPDVELRNQRDPLLNYDPALSELNGSLCMVQPDAESCGTNLWLLTDSNNSTWVKVFMIPFDSLGFDDRLIPLRMLSDGKRLLFSNFCKNTDLSSVQIYDAHSWEFTDAPKALAGVYDTNFSPCC